MCVSTVGIGVFTVFVKELQIFIHMILCRLDSECTVKVADAALAQQFYPECYYTLFGATRPVRWAAVETLQEGLCTTRSNVVSCTYLMQLRMDYYLSSAIKIDVA